MHTENRHRVEDIKQCWISDDSQQEHLHFGHLYYRIHKQIEQPCLHIHKNGLWKCREEKNRPEITLKQRKNAHFTSG